MRRRPHLALALTIATLITAPFAEAGGLGKRLDVHVATGDAPTAIVFGNLSKPKRIAVRASENVADVVEGDSDLVCTKGHRTRREQRELRFEGRRVIRFRPSLRRADRCILTVDAFTAGRGRIKLELFGKRRV